MNEYDEPIDESVHNIQDFWQTAQGRFRIKIDELPDQLQLVYHILKVCTSIFIDLVNFNVHCNCKLNIKISWVKH